MPHEDFAAFLHALGLRPGLIAADGRVRRCATEEHPRKRNGAYWLAESGVVGWGQDWSVMAERAEWRAAQGGEGPRVVVDHEAIRRQRMEAEARARRAIEDARDFYLNKTTPVRGGHPYLERQGLDVAGCLGLRVDRNGWLVVPAFRHGALQTVQRIAPDGTKRFWKGAPAAGATYLIDRPGAALTVLCEGLATGLALWAASGMARVVVSFSAGNMVKAAETGRFSGMMAVAADNDHRTVCRPHRDAGLQAPFDPWERRPEWCVCNPGRVAALSAANSLGVGVLVPLGIEGTDWADWRAENVVSHGRSRAEVDSEIQMHILRAARLVRQDGGR